MAVPGVGMGGTVGMVVVGATVGMVVAGADHAGDRVGPALTSPDGTGALAALGLMTVASWMTAVTAAAPNITRTIVLTVRSTGRH